MFATGVQPPPQPHEYNWLWAVLALMVMVTVALRLAVVSELMLPILAGVYVAMGLMALHSFFSQENRNANANERKHR